MTGEKLDMDGKDCINKKEHERKIFFLARLHAWIMTVLECLGTDETHGGTRQKHLVSVL